MSLIISYALLGTSAYASLSYKIAFVSQTKKEMKITYKQPSILGCVSIIEPSTLILPRPKSLQWFNEVAGYVTITFKKNLLCNPKNNSVNFEIFAKNDYGYFSDLATLIVTPKFTTTTDDGVIDRYWKPSITIQHHAAYNPKDIVIRSQPGGGDSKLEGDSNRIALCDVSRAHAC